MAQPAAVDLDCPQRWRLKGEGNANWVFAYTGDRPHLVGKVLRVRKAATAWTATAVQESLERAVWGPVLGGDVAAASLPASSSSSSNSSSTAAVAAWEWRYVLRLLAPLLGQQHIPWQHLVQPSPAFLLKLLESNGCGPRHSSRQCSGGGSGGDGGSPAAPVAALMPDVTLLPTPTSGDSACNSRPPFLCEPDTIHSVQAAAAGAGAGAGAGARAPSLLAPAWQSEVECEGPMACVELKPKCGFITDCGTVHPDNHALKRSRSRYQLHQMLKMEQGKIGACSRYDPCDLFSGDPLRLRTALAALLDHPQNNLLLFLDGHKQSLPWQQHKPPQQRLPQPAGSSVHAATQQLVGEQQAGQQGSSSTCNAQRCVATTEQRPPQAQQSHRQAAGRPPAPAQQPQLAPPPPMGDLLAGLLAPLPPPKRQAALVELLAAALEREGVLPRLLQAQKQCRYDIEGVYRLYRQLEAAAAAAAAGQWPEETVTQATSGGGSSSTAADTHAHVAAVAQLLSLPPIEAHAVLRSYVVATTAKDCAIMVALQRLAGPPPGVLCAAAALGGAAGAGVADSGDGSSRSSCARQGCSIGLDEEAEWCSLPPGCLRYHWAAAADAAHSGSFQQHQMHQPPPPQQQQVHQPPPQQQQHRHPSCRCCLYFRYRLAFVDLDKKPLAKIPHHYAHDQRILAAARRQLAGSGSDGGALGVAAAPAVPAGGRLVPGVASPIQACAAAAVDVTT